MKLFPHLAILLFSFLNPMIVFAQEHKKCLDLLVNIRDWKETDLTQWDHNKEGTQGGALFYFGAEHKDDPSHLQFEMLRRRFETFKPSLAFYEGPDRGIATTDTATIKQFGESGYVRWLAGQANIPIVSLEPAFTDLYAYLLSKYSHEQVDLYMFAKEASRLHHRKNMDKEAVLQAINQVIAKVPSMTGPNEPLLTSIPQIEHTYRKYFTQGYEWWQLPQSFFDPAKSGTAALFTNDLSELSSTFRNIYMVQKLAKEVYAGKRVFAVVGRNHVPLQAAALDCAID